MRTSPDQNQNQNQNQNRGHCQGRESDKVWTRSPRPEGDRDSWRDRGAASILVLALGVVLVAAGIAGAAVGAARVGRHQARTAADLGALAGAARAVEGPAAACERARHLASVNGARMTSCRLEGLELVIDVQVTVTPLPGLTRYASAAARAGPVSLPAG